MRKGTRWTTAVVAAALIGAGAVGCSDDDSGSSESTPSATVSTEPTGSASPSPSPSGGKKTVKVTSGSLGAILTDGDGRTLYLFEKDKSGKSACSGDCTKAWPPFTTDGKPQAGDGVKSGLLNVVAGNGGSKQATYHGHPLYYYEGDRKPGDVNGQDLDQFGAEWYVLDAAGNKVTKEPEGDQSASPSGSPSETSGTTGGGY